MGKEDAEVFLDLYNDFIAKLEHYWEQLNTLATHWAKVDKFRAAWEEVDKADTVVEDKGTFVRIKRPIPPAFPADVDKAVKECEAECRRIDGECSELFGALQQDMAIQGRWDLTLPQFEYCDRKEHDDQSFARRFHEIREKAIGRKLYWSKFVKLPARHAEETPAPQAGQSGKALSRTIDDIVGNGESSEVEFKTTLRINQHTGKKDPKMELAVLKTIAGFLNTNGGTLVIGVSDDGKVLGIDVDGFGNEDKMSLHLVNLIKDRMSPTIMPFIHARFEDYKGCRVMVIECSKAGAPVFVKDGNVELFYIRTGPSTTELRASQTHEYIKQHWCPK